MASESSGFSAFSSAEEGFGAPEIHVPGLTDVLTPVKYENIVFPNAPIQKYAKVLI